MRRYSLVVSLCLLNMAYGEENSSGIDPSGVSSTQQGIVFYVCGAGGGSFLSSWAPGVRKGLQDAGAPVEFREFLWQTGLGAWADQTSSVGYKRSKGEKLAEQIVSYRKEHPENKVTLIGLSAGTAVVVYALEALPETCQVNHVILLGSSLDANYDMSVALTRVGRDLYVFTSEKDEILNVFVPMTGSADRRYVGTDLVGICGFHPLRQADESVRDQYKKIRTISWHQEFTEVGDYGGHTDTTNPQFVKKYLVPIVVAPTTVAAAENKAETVQVTVVMAN